MNIDNVLSIGRRNEPILFSWDIIDICQFNCSYCSSVDLLTNKSTNVCSSRGSRNNWQVVLNRLRLIKSKFKICLAGGEPSLHPDILEIMTQLNGINNLVEIVLNTNICNIKIFNNFKQKELDKVIVVPSYHYEYDITFRKNIHALRGIRTIVAINIPNDKRYWNMTKNILQILKESDIEFKITFLHSTSSFDSKYDDEVFEYFKDEIENCSDISGGEIIVQTKSGEAVYRYTDIIENKLNLLKDWKCNSNTFNIDVDGNISNACNNKPLPLILSMYDFSQCIRCPLDTCVDERNFTFLKERDIYGEKKIED